MQDALARAFVTLGRMFGETPQNPRAWLFRVASNLWTPLFTDGSAGFRLKPLDVVRFESGVVRLSYAVDGPLA